MNAERIASALDKAKRNGKGWMACCPAHIDSNPSLSIDDGKNGCILVHCHAGCYQDAVLEAIKSKCGIDLRNNQTDQRFLHYQLGNPSAVYDYQDLNGRLIGHMCRFDKADGSKEFRPYVKIGGIFKWEGFPEPRPLYNLPVLKEKPEARALIVEGEKTCLAAERIFPDMAVLTWPHGAKAWAKADWTVLLGREVIIWPDNDAEGKKAATGIADHLMSQGICKKVAIVELPDGLQEGWDLADVIPENFDVQTLAQNAVRIEPQAKDKKLFTAAELMAMELPPIKFIADSLVPEGLTIFAGKPKIGKSWLVLALGLAVANGKLSLGKYQTVAGKVIYYALEDRKARFKDRLQRLKDVYDLNDDLIVKFEAPTSEDGGLSALRSELDQYPETRLVIIDTLQKFKKPSRGNSQLYADDYKFIGDLKTLADLKGIGIILVHHLRKMGSSDVFDEISGTLGLTGAADTNLILKKDRGNADAFLHCTGRDIEEMEIALEFKNFNWQYVSDGDSAKLNPLQRGIISILEKEGALDAPSLREKLGAEHPKLTSSNFKTTLSRMVRNGLIRNYNHKYSVPKAK